MIRDNQASFGLLSIALHWVSALLIVFLFGLGLYMVDLTYYDPWYTKGPELHISLGIALFFTTVVRILWRLVNARRPAPLAEHSWTVRLLSATVQHSLYVLVLIVIVSGYLITTADGKSAQMFGLLSIPAVTKLDGSSVDVVGAIHYWLACAIIVLSALHAAAALLHHFVMRDRTLTRMLNPRSPQ